MADALRQAWATVLGKEISEIEDDANFFEIGGDSVQAIKLAAHTSKNAGLKLNSQQVFRHPIFSAMRDAATTSETDSGNKGDYPTTKELEPKRNAVDRAHDALKAFKLVNDCLAQCDMHEALLEDIVPCTPFQCELMNASHSLGCWLFQAVFEISRNAEERTKHIINDLHTRNPVFRTRIAQYEKGLYQIVSKSLPEWQVFEGSVEVFQAKESSKRMQFGDPLSRCAIVHDPSRDSSYIVWTQTHAIYDRWSKMHVLEDLQNAFRDPDRFRSSPKRLAFKNFVEKVESGNTQQSIQFWKEQIQGLKHYGKLFDIPPNRQFKTSVTQSHRKITAFRRPSGTNVTFATVSQVAWALVLARESKVNDVFFCSFRSCRQMDLDSVDTIIGPLWSLVPVRMQLEAHQTLDEVLQKVHQLMVEGIPHEPHGITALDEYFGHQGYLQSVLLPQPPQPDTFGMTLTTKDTKTGDEMTLRSAEELWHQTRGHFGLYVMLTPKGEELELWGRFDESVIDAERVSGLLDKYASVMNSIYDSNWRETTIATFVPELPEEPGHSKGQDKVSTDAIDDRDDIEYSLEGIDRDKPATLRHLLNQKSPNALACAIPLEDKTVEITYENLEKHVQNLQRSLAELGIKHGSAVSMSLGNIYELIISFIATTRQRAIAAPLNPAYKQNEFEFYVDDLSSSLVLIAKGKFADKEPAVQAARKYKAAIAEVSWNSDSSEVVLDVKEKGKLQDCDHEEEMAEPVEGDVALVLHTSGTTGRPKAVPLTHKNLVTSIDNICSTYRLRPHDRTMLIMPLFHVHGLLASFLSPLRSGGAAIVPERLTPEFWNQFKDNHATWYSATPTMHRMILQFPLPESGLPKIRFIRSCSSRLAPALFEELEKKFQAPVLESYAMTEASHMMTSNLLPPGARYSGSVGQPQNLDLKILDENGQEVEQGKEAEVCIRGSNVTKGYLNNEEANRSSFTEEGYFRTGDQGKIDENGFLVLTGRLKELINKGGEKISPVELDNMISQHKDITECVSFGIEDEDYGQEIGCAIKMKDGKDQMDVKALKKWIGERLAAHKVPKQIWFPDEIPKTATGKVQRKMVAEKMKDEKSA